MTCETCGKEFIEDYRKDPSSRKTPARFCSRSCSNVVGRQKYSEERFCEYCKKSLGIGWHSESKKYCCIEHQQAAKSQKLLEYWLETGSPNGYTGGTGGNTPHAGYLRDYLLSEQKHCCAICGDPDTWKDKPLKLILDHIDGNCKNNARINLRLICPNCNSQTDTFSGRNRGKGRKSKGYSPHGI